MKHYMLDPAHFYTSPGLAWQAALKVTGVRMELLSHMDMLLMFEKGIKGGMYKHAIDMLKPIISIWATSMILKRIVCFFSIWMQIIFMVGQ